MLSLSIDDPEIIDTSFLTRCDAYWKEFADEDEAHWGYMVTLPSWDRDDAPWVAWSKTVQLPSASCELVFYTYTGPNPWRSGLGAVQYEIFIGGVKAHASENGAPKWMRKTVDLARSMSALAPLAGETEAVLVKLEKTARHLGKMAGSEQMMTAFAHAYTFMDVTGDAVMAWMLLWRALVAAGKLEKGAAKKDLAFYEGQVAGARFFIRTVLPATLGKMDAILVADGIAVEMAEEAFGGK